MGDLQVLRQAANEPPGMGLATNGGGGVKTAAVIEERPGLRQAELNYSFALQS